jgi:hypothetical protein
VTVAPKNKGAQYAAQAVNARFQKIAPLAHMRQARQHAPESVGQAGRSADVHSPQDAQVQKVKDVLGPGTRFFGARACPEGLEGFHQGPDTALRLSQDLVREGGDIPVILIRLGLTVSERIRDNFH